MRSYGYSVLRLVTNGLLVFPGQRFTETVSRAHLRGLSGIYLCCCLRSSLFWCTSCLRGLLKQIINKQETRKETSDKKKISLKWRILPGNHLRFLPIHGKSKLQVPQLADQALPLQLVCFHKLLIIKEKIVKDCSLQGNDICKISRFLASFPCFWKLLTSFKFCTTISNL